MSVHANSQTQEPELAFSDTARFVGEYVPLLADASWYRKKFDRLAEIAVAPRRFSEPLVELALPAIRELERAGRESGFSRNGGHKERGTIGSRSTREEAGDEGHGYARAYLAGLDQLAGQTLSTPEAIHAGIQRGERVIAPGIATVPAALASAMIGVVDGGSVATASAMRTVERYAKSFIL